MAISSTRLQNCVLTFIPHAFLRSRIGRAQPKEPVVLSKTRLSVLLAALVLPLAGCGSETSSGGVGADPAKVVPAGAPLYVEAVLRPDGELGDGVNEALRKLMRTDDPGAKLTELLTKATARSDIKWDEVKQWLGPRVGVFVTEIDGENSVGALVANTTDTEKAKATLDKAVRESNGRGASAIVGDYAVIGSPEGVKAVQATADGGKPLSDSPDFTAARDAAAADDGLGFVYAEPQGLLDAVAKMAAAGGGKDNPFGDPQGLAVLRELFAKAGRVAALSLHADGDAVRMDGASIGAPAAGESTAADQVADLPADAWLAIGFGDIGASLDDAFAQMSQLAGMAGPGAPNFEEVFRVLEQRLGVNIRADFLSWMGEGAVYARGRGIADLGGALTIRTKNADKSRKAVGILAQGLAKAGANVRAGRIEGYDVALEVRSASAPISVWIAANAERFTIGVNPDALRAILAPDEKLGDSERYAQAVSALGGDIEPVMIVDTQTIVGIAETFGASEAEGYAKVKPYLESLGPISAGTARDGDVSRFSFALGLR